VHLAADGDLSLARSTIQVDLEAGDRTVVEIGLTGIITKRTRGQIRATAELKGRVLRAQLPLRIER
jgi:hypothetical protein